MAIASSRRELDIFIRATVQLYGTPAFCRSIGGLIWLRQIDLNYDSTKILSSELTFGWVSRGELALDLMLSAS